MSHAGGRALYAIPFPSGPEAEKSRSWILAVSRHGDGQVGLEPNALSEPEASPPS